MDQLLFSFNPLINYSINCCRYYQSQHSISVFEIHTFLLSKVWTNSRCIRNKRIPLSDSSIRIKQSKKQSHCLTCKSHSGAVGTDNPKWKELHTSAWEILYLQFSFGLYGTEAESMWRTEWTSHHSPSAHLTQPWEFKSHYHPDSHSLSCCPLGPFPTSPSRRVKTFTGVSDWTVPPLTDRLCGALAHFSLQDSDWLPRNTNAHSYTNAHILYLAPQPPVSRSHARVHLDSDPNWYGDVLTLHWRVLKRTCILIKMSSIVTLFFWCLCQEWDLPPPTQQCGAAVPPTARPYSGSSLRGKAQEEHATCHSPLMYLSPLLCGRLTPTQKPVFSLGTRAQVAGGGKVELQRWLSQFKSLKSQGEDTFSLTKNIQTTVWAVNIQ